MQEDFKVMSHPGGEDPVKKLIDGWTCLCVRNTPEGPTRSPHALGIRTLSQPLIILTPFISAKPFSAFQKREETGSGRSPGDLGHRRSH